MNPTAPATTRKSRRVPLANVAVLLIATSMFGQVLGFLRTKLINANFNTPHTPVGQNAGVYFAAFSIPDFFFFTIAAGALGVAVMPYLSDRLHKGDRKGVWELSASLLNFLAIIMAGVALVIIVFAKPLIHHVVAPGLTPEQLNNAAMLMRLLALNPLLFTVSGILTSAQQTMGRFFFYAIAPLFYNLCIIISIYAFRNNIGIVGLGIGALIGAILQLVVVAFGSMRLSFHWHPRIMWRSGEFRSMLKQLPPRSLDQGMDQLQSIVETNFASRQVLGGATAISNYNNAYILHTAPILLIGTAISTAAFPRLNQRLSQGRPDLFRKDFLMILRAMIWITLPVIIICYFARGYLARLIFTNNNADIALIFGFLTAAIFFRVMYAIMSRWFYAQKDTKTPLFVSIFTISFNIFLAWKLSQPSAYGVAGLALAQSIVAGTEVVILAVIMLFRDRGLFNMAFWGGVIRIISVSGFSVVAGFIMISLYPLGINDTGIITLGGKLALIAAVVFGVHIAMSALFGLEEVRPFFFRVKKLILKPIRLEY
ncbi:MAG TPA: lipid II flippase MurJ [Candidatus Saccharimonadales bacterium]|nr:lipid II flippase MurJ [Candidatus Saccharimonadales bacterium]